MNSHDPLRCTYDDARRNTLLQGIGLDTRAKVAFFEEMVSFAFQFGAVDKLAGRRASSTESGVGARPIEES